MPKINLKPQRELALYSSSKYEQCFQAIGRINAQIAVDLNIWSNETTNNLGSIILERQKFSLYSIGGKGQKDRIDTFKRKIANCYLGLPNQTYYDLEIIVYPIIDESDGKLSTGSFSYRNIIDDLNLSKYDFLKPNHFILSGLWESLNDRTCIQVYSKNLAKPLNIPVNWDSCPIQLNHKDSIHISVEALFNPNTGKFDYVRTLKEPSKYHSPFYRRSGIKYTPPIIRSTPLPTNNLNYIAILIENLDLWYNNTERSTAVREASALAEGGAQASADYK